MRATSRLIGTLALTLLVAGSAGALTVAGFGDSLTQGPDYLQYLPGEWTTLDFGKPGEESWDGIERLRGLLPTLEADVVVIMEGTNDVRHGGYTDERSLGSLTGMVLEVQAYGLRPVLAAPPPLYSPDSEVANERLAYLAGALGDFAAPLGVPFVDLYDAFQQLADPASYFQDDGVHPWTDGRMFIASQIAPAVRLAAPEPSGALLLGAGLAALALARRGAPHPAAPRDGRR
jgi:lysophospholipase L1-like esterase